MGMAEEVQGLSDLYGAVSTGSDQMVFMGYDEQGRPIAVQNIPNFTYDDKWNYQPNLKMGPITIDPATGEPVFAENAADVTYRQVTENILNNMFNSGFLGSDLTDTGSSTAVQ
jgi:hypothetical protein